MRATASEGFAAGSCPTVVLATMFGYWDALTASSLAGLFQAPILLIDGRSLSPQTTGEIRRLDTVHVFVAGGPAAISDNVIDQIRAVGDIEAVRLAGNNATGNTVKIFCASNDWGDTAVVAISNSFS